MTAIMYMLTVGGSPASAELVNAIRQVQVETSTAMASVFRITVGIGATAAGDWTILQDDVFKPRTAVGIRVQVGSKAAQALINGYVSGLEASYSDQPGESTLDVQGMDATLLMNLTETVKAWPNLADSVIATQILGNYKLSTQVKTTSPPLTEPEGTTLQRATDIRFLRRLAERNGFECYVQPEPVSGTDMGYFQPPQLSGPAQAAVTVGAGAVTDVSDFRVRYQMLHPTSAVATHLDAATKAVQTGEAQTPQLQTLGREGALARLTQPPVVLPTQSGLVHSADLKALAQALVDRSAWAVVAEGKVGGDVGVLRPGGLLNVRGAGRFFSGTYYLTGVLHVLSKEGYSQSFQAWRNAVGMTGSESFRS